jgi:hypothetical protein
VAPYFGQAYYTYTAGISVSNTFVELLSGGVVSGGYPGGECLEVINAFTENYNIATAVGLRLISYEGGNNLGGGVNGATFLTCQTDSRMTTVYDTILNAWFALSNIGPFIHYTDIADINSAGAYWGALVNVQQTTSIKYAALLSFITPPPSPPTAVIPIPMGQAWM